MNGIKLVSTTLEPNSFNWVSGTTVVLKPVLAWLEVVVVAVVVVSPPVLRPRLNQRSSSPSLKAAASVVVVISVPVQLVSHSFHTVPRMPDSSACATNWSYTPSSSITTSGLTSVSFHSSDSGDNLTCPPHENTLYGLTNSDVVA